MLSLNKTRNNLTKPAKGLIIVGSFGDNYILVIIIEFTIDQTVNMLSNRGFHICFLKQEIIKHLT